MFATEIVIPTECKGPCHVRLLAADGKTHALGAATLYVRPRPVGQASPSPGPVGQASRLVPDSPR
jgi:hypothetical protein